MTEKPFDEEAIFKIACQIASQDARIEYLQQICGDNVAHFGRIVSLLRVYEEESGFFESRAQGIGAATKILSISEKPGTLIGPYKLLQVIGEGGMGLVYMAEQTEPVKRKVALKLIKPGMDSHQVLARFEAERQALVLMDHVNIARVLDAGTNSSEPGSASPGRPYFVMELIHGVPITKYCDDNHLTPRQRLELFVPVCQAIQHAHQKGIIHRDIKPSNVMITLYDGKPVPKVIDFGVAKATEQKLTERTLFTQYGTMVGTLEYMSPEQAGMSALGVDTRSDIYSLGVLLYELLTGSTPLGRERVRVGAFAEVLRLIKDEDPPKPSTRLSESGELLASISAQRNIAPAQLTKLMRGELDWIVMKTLEKDRNRRYESASGFAADVQRYLNDEPVQACPPSAGYRLRKFARRNHLAMTSAALVGAALGLGTIVSVWQAVRATQAEEQAQENFQKAEAQRKRAERHLLIARDAVNHMAEVGQGRLKDIPHSESVCRELLEKALGVYQSFIEEVSDDPLVRQETGRAYLRVGGIQRHLGEPQKAIDSYQQAIKVFESLLAEFPSEPDYRNDFANGQAGFGLLISSRLPEAKAVLSLATEIQKKVVAEYPDRSEFRTDLINSQHLYAWVLMYNPTAPDMQEAEKVLRQIQQIQEKIEPADQRPEHNTDALYGDVYFNTGRLEEAEKVWRRSLARYQKLVSDFPIIAGYRDELAHRYENLAWVQERTDRLEPAEQSYRQSLSIRRTLTAEFPDVSGYDDMLTRTIFELSELLRRSGRLDQSVAVYEEALSLHEAASGPSHLISARSMNNLAWIIARSADAGIRNHQRAAIIAEKAVELAPQNRAYLNTLGVAHYRVGDWKAAIAALEKSMAVSGGGDANDWLVLAMAQWQLGEQVRARQYYQQAIDWIDQHQSKEEQLGRFRAEAAELLGIAENVLPAVAP